MVSDDLGTSIIEVNLARRTLAVKIGQGLHNSLFAGTESILAGRGLQIQTDHDLMLGLRIVAHQGRPMKVFLIQPMSDRIQVRIPGKFYVNQCSTPEVNSILETVLHDHGGNTGDQKYNRYDDEVFLLPHPIDLGIMEELHALYAFPYLLDLTPVRQFKFPEICTNGLDAQRFSSLAFGEHVIKNHSRNKDRCKEVRHQTDRQSHSKALDRTGAKSKQNGCCGHSGHMGINNGLESVIKPARNRRRSRFTHPQFLADSLKDQHV